MGYVLETSIPELRLCHLNLDGSSISTYGFEIIKHFNDEYPIISNIESKSLGEYSGLKLNDILLKINEQNTNDFDFDQIKQLIDISKVNHHQLNMLVVDKETFDYCQRTNRKFKQPDIKIKHIYPQMDTIYSSPSQDSLEILKTNDYINLQQHDDSSYISPISKMSTSIDLTLFSATQKTDTDETIMDFVSNTINHVLHDIEESQSDKCSLIYRQNDRINSSKISIPIQSTESYDYIDDSRRCTLKIEADKGLGFILGAMNDYEHKIAVVQKNSPADIAGLQKDDELVEINGVDVRHVKYEKIVNLLISEMKTKEIMELCVINNTKRKSTSLNDDEMMNQSKNRKFHSSVITLSTGITGSPRDLHPIKPNSIVYRHSNVNLFDFGKTDTPIARLCRIRKFPSSPFYGFFLHGERNKLGHVFISNVRKNSSAAICGLRNGDRIIEVNGTNVLKLTYETILNKIKLHMDYHDLELLVLDKKAFRWYQQRNCSITSETLSTIIHIEPIIKDMNYAIENEAITKL